MNRFIRTLVCWLTCFELLAWLRGWRGLSWLRSPWSRLALATMGTMAGWHLARQPLRSLPALLLSLGPALSAQLLGSLWRNRGLDPLVGLRPGAAQRTVEAVEVPLGSSFMPALHLAPVGSTLGAVAIIHGSGCDKQCYTWRLADVLLARGLGLLLVDIDGHGENPRPQSWPGIEQNAWAAVAWLRERYGWVGIVGYSLGGCIAAHAAASGLDADAVVVLEAPASLDYGWHEIRREARELLRPAFWHVLADSSLYHFVAAWGFAPIRCTIGTASLIAALDLLGSLPRITAPLLLLYGGADAIVPLAQAAAARAAAPPHARFALAPAASHLSLILDPQALTLMGDWLLAQASTRVRSHKRV